MIAEAFMVCALTLPGVSFTRPPVVSWHAAKSEQEKLEDFIRKHNPEADIVFDPTVGKNKLKQHGWERVPFTWRGQDIWIRRAPRGDQRMTKRMETSA